MTSTDGKRLVRLPVVIAFVAIALGCSKCAPTGSKDDRLGQGEGLLDLDGTVHRPFGNSNVQAVVLVFIVPDCPIANAYAPELNRIFSEYGPRGTGVYLIQVNPELSIEEARKHVREYQLQPPVVLDANHVWVQKVGATRTPEAVVLTSDGKVLYLGRIDDRYADLGKRREHVRSHDLRDALDAVLAGRPVLQSRTTAVGCIIPDLK
jgi:hypothetical protein